MAIARISGFEVGAELHLERERVSATTKLRGWKEGVYIIVDIPDGRWRIKDTNPIICRLLADGKYYGFTTLWLGVLPEINLMMLEYPDDIVDTSLRDDKRFTVSLPISIVRNHDGRRDEFPALMTDLSVKGCQIVSPSAVNTNDKLELSGGLPGGESFKDVIFTVKQITQEGVKFVLGGALEIPSEAGKQAFDRLISQLMVYLKG